jgi:hypothetical protein
MMLIPSIASRKPNTDATATEDCHLLRRVGPFHMVNPGMGHCRSSHAAHQDLEG